MNALRFVFWLQTHERFDDSTGHGRPIELPLPGARPLANGGFIPGKHAFTLTLNVWKVLGHNGETPLFLIARE